MDNTEIFPAVLYPLITGYWRTNPIEDLWSVFETFCHNNNFIKEFTEEQTWRIYSSSTVLENFIASLKVFKEKFSDRKSKDDSYSLLVDLGRNLFVETDDKKMTNKLWNQWKKLNPHTCTNIYNCPDFLNCDYESFHAWSEGKYEDYGQPSFLSFLPMGKALKDTDPTTILLYYVMLRGIRCATSFVNYLAYQFGSFYKEKGFYWFLFICLHGVWFASPPLISKELLTPSEYAMEGAFLLAHATRNVPCIFNKDS